MTPITREQAARLRWEKMDPKHIAQICSPRHIQSVLEDAQQTIACLQAKLDQSEARVRELKATIVDIRESLELANNMPNGPISDTIWHTEYETLFDYIDAALNKEPGNAV